MKNQKWLVVNVESSKTIRALREIVASFETLTECEEYIKSSNLENLQIRARW